jgi:hypothetical protein
LFKSDELSVDAFCNGKPFTGGKHMPKTFARKATKAGSFKSARKTTARKTVKARKTAKPTLGKAKSTKPTWGKSTRTAKPISRKAKSTRKTTKARKSTKTTKASKSTKPGSLKLTTTKFSFFKPYTTKTTAARRRAA